MVARSAAGGARQADRKADKLMTDEAFVQNLDAFIGGRSLQNFGSIIQVEDVCSSLCVHG